MWCRHHVETAEQQSRQLGQAEGDDATLTGTGLSEKRTPMPGRTYTMRELLTQARERFGADAARYKTRQELLDALGLGATPVELPSATPSGPAPQPTLVVKDFFLPREKP